MNLNMPPSMKLLNDLRKLWPEDEAWIATQDLVDRLIRHNSEEWGTESYYGKPLTVQRFGQILSKGFKIHSERTGSSGNTRGYSRERLAKAWRTLAKALPTPHEESAEPTEPAKPAQSAAF